MPVVQQNRAKTRPAPAIRNLCLFRRMTNHVTHLDSHAALFAQRGALPEVLGQVEKEPAAVAALFALAAVARLGVSSSGDCVGYGDTSLADTTGSSPLAVRIVVVHGAHQGQAGALLKVVVVVQAVVVRHLRGMSSGSKCTNQGLFN